MAEDTRTLVIFIILGVTLVAFSAAGLILPLYGVAVSAKIWEAVFMIIGIFATAIKLSGTPAGK